MASQQLLPAVRRWKEYLGKPVDAASLGFFRLAFGLLVAIDALRFVLHGWIEEYFLNATVHFTYPFFGFVRPWPGNLMYLHFAVMTAAALLVSCGLFYRAASVVLFLAYAYFFLLEKSIYMNHYYLIALLSFLLALMPADRALSLRPSQPEIPATVPMWTVFMLRFQLFVLYFYGGIAKLNPDWLRGEPMYSALVRGGPDLPPGATLLPPALLAYVIAYAGLLIDLGAPILLSFARTRWLGFVFLVPFHALNEIFLNIGIFSYLALCAITIFLPPDWPRRLVRIDAAPVSAANKPPGRMLLMLLHAHMAIQLLVPLRHLAYPGYVSWTEEGHRFAWHMKLREKRSTMRIVATDPATGRSWEIDPHADLRPRQVRKLQTFPDILLQYVHHHRDRLRAQGIEPVIRVDWQCSLNGRPYQNLVDPDRNLAAVEPSFGAADWILPLRP